MSEIRTSDCIAAIKKSRPGDLEFAKISWKRNAKYRADDPRDVDYNQQEDEVWVREFITAGDDKENPKTIAYVWASTQKVLEVRVLESVGDPNQLFEMNPHNGCVSFKESLNRGGFETATTPMVKDENGDYERLDFENYELVRVDGNYVTLWHGGDWQDPMEVTYRMMSDRKLYYVPGTEYAKSL